MTEHLLQWVSSKLSLNIKSVEQEQFNDGVIILRLLAALTGEPLEPHPSAHKSLAMQKNAAQILTFTQQRSINIGNAGVAEILSGKEKDVLRILYYLFSSFAPKQEMEQFNKVNQTASGSSSLFPLIDKYTNIPSNSEARPVKPTSDSDRQNRLSFSRLSISDKTTSSPSSSAIVGNAANSTGAAKTNATEPKKEASQSTGQPSSLAPKSVAETKPVVSTTQSMPMSSPISSVGQSTAHPNGPPAQQVAKTFLQNSITNLKDKLDNAIPMKPKAFIDCCEDYFKTSIASFEDILKTTNITEKEASQLLDQFKTWLKEFMDKYRQKNNEVYMAKTLPIVKQNIAALTEKLANCKTAEEQQKVMDEFKMDNDFFAEVQQFMPEFSSQITSINSHIDEIKVEAQRKLVKKNKKREEARVRKQKEDAEKKALQKALDRAKREKEEVEAQRIATEKKAQEEIERAKREREEAEARRIAAERQRVEDAQKKLEAEKRGLEAEKARLQLEREQALKAQPQIVHHRHYYSSSDSSSDSSCDFDSSSSEEYRRCRGYTTKGRRCKKQIAYGHKKYCRTHSTSKNW